MQRGQSQRWRQQKQCPIRFLPSGFLHLLLSFQSCQIQGTVGLVALVDIQAGRALCATPGTFRVPAASTRSQAACSCILCKPERHPPLKLGSVLVVGFIHIQIQSFTGSLLRKREATRHPVVAAMQAWAFAAFQPCLFLFGQHVLSSNGVHRCIVF